MTTRWSGLTTLAAVAVLLVAACGSGERTYGEGDGPISVAVGETFSISLEANPGVGDDWRVVSIGEPAIVDVIASRFESDAPDDVAGAPGRTVFEFEATARDGTEIEILNCYRCVGDEPAPEDEGLNRTVTFSVDVS